MLLQRLGEAVAAFDPRANVANDVAHDLVGGLVRQRLQGLHHRQAGIDHRRQLPREDHQVGQRHPPAAGPALFADLLLDREDQHIAVQQGRDGRLLGGRLDRTADLPAGGRFPRYIDE